MIKLNVGGKIFQTTKETLCSTGSGFFRDLLSERTETSESSRSSQISRDSDGTIFIDRNPRYFEVLLDYLRSGELLESGEATSSNQRILQREAKFYGIDLPSEEKKSSSSDTTTPSIEACVVQVRRSGSGYSIRRVKPVLREKDQQQPSDEGQGQGRVASPRSSGSSTTTTHHHPEPQQPASVEESQLLAETTVHERPNELDRVISSMLREGWDVATSWDDPSTYQQSVHFKRQRTTK